MTPLRPGSTLVTRAICAVVAIYILVPPVFSANNAANSTAGASGNDVFEPKEPGVHREMRKRWSRLDQRLNGAKRAAQPGLYVRDKWALVIGVSRYQDASIKRVRVARNNALLMGAVLKEPTVGRFPSEHAASVVGRAATKSGVEDAILESSLVKKALPNDLILLYISARIVPLINEGDLCLCTYDTLASEPGRSGVKLAETLSNLRKRTQCPQILCILDCVPVGKDDFANGGAVTLEEVSKKSGVSIISANRFKEDIAAYGTGMFSPFTIYFTDALRNSSGTLALSLLVNYVQENLQREHHTLVEEACFIPAEANPTAQDMVIGVPPRSAWSPRNFALGHDTRTLAMQRPDLLTSPHGALLASEPQRPKIINGKTPEDDAGQSKFSSVDFGPWMDKMKRDIRSKWNPPKGLTQSHVVTLFTIMKDGSISEPSIVESSGAEAVDQSALEALKIASPLDPLPAGAPASVQIRYVFDWRLKPD